MEAVATTKGQIVIPAAIRRQLGIREGTRIQIEVDEVNRRLILTPITRDYIRSLRGSLKGNRAMKVLIQERQKEKKL
jgi:AbrB family looped-hinge helix DNA binding protein